MKDKLSRWALPTAIVVALVLIVIYFMSKRKDEFANVPDEVPPPFNAQKNGPCPGDTLEFKMYDVYMRGVIEKGQKFKAIMNYYSCNPLKRGDVVMYQPGENAYPIVKYVRGLPGDKFRLEKDRKMNAWNIFINGKLLMDGGRPYFFGSEQPPTLSLYEKPRNGILKPNEILLFSSWAPGDRDSGIFGIYTVESLVGKVIVPDKSEETPGASPVLTEEPTESKGTENKSIAPTEATPQPKSKKTPKKKHEK